MSDQVNPNVALGIVSSLVATGVVFIQFLVKRGNVDIEKERWLLEFSKANQEELAELRSDIRRYIAEREQDKATILALSNRVAELDIALKAAQTQLKHMTSDIVPDVD